MIDYAIVQHGARPLIKSSKADSQAPRAPRVGIALDISARPATTTSRKPQPPAKRPITATEMRREKKSLKLQQRDRRQHQQLQQYGGDLLPIDEDMLDAHFTPTAPAQRDGSVWEESREAERCDGIRGAPQWIRNSLAHRQNPRMSDVLGALYGQRANAAERALSTITQAPLRKRARRGQPIARSEAPRAHRVAGKHLDAAKAEQQR